MKQIIDGLLYDTEESEVVYKDDTRVRVLYRTKNGRYFTFYGNGEIIPRSEDTVKEYLGKVDIAKYIELFGEVKEA